MSLHHNVLSIHGGAGLTPEFHSSLANVIAEDWQSGTAQGLKTFADPVENTVPVWVKRRNANNDGSDKMDTISQPPSEEVSTYGCACCKLRVSLRDREATTEEVNAFLSTAAPLDYHKSASRFFARSSSLTHVARRFSLTRRSKSKEQPPDELPS
ncbi:MAG: hypothetical protein Q9161_007603 [Pseudevernia consocians]